MIRTSSARFPGPAIPSRVNVRVDSQLTIHPDSADWVAVLRYDVLGGALELDHLRMPAAWSAPARAPVPGKRPPVDHRNSRPDRDLDDHARTPGVGLAAAGSAGETLRFRPSERSPTLKFPRWDGWVDACLAVVIATGRPATVENSAGLDPVEYSSRFQSREFAAPRVFRWARFGWSRSPRDSRSSIGSRGRRGGRIA